MGQTRKLQCVMRGNAANNLNPYDIKKRDESQQTKYITWLKQDVNDNQRLIHQPVSKNKWKKLKKKVKMSYSAKIWAINQMVLKLFAKQRAQKSQLE